eukprot:TRINITY_DN93390_c0_g1_i1.p1 TRINITY_DN93390_c0_g1~~TRINITY_DN93390_c0_g1_i1.p1  ORF type:complete len:327 (-),score=73.26 TRINITY_DN93390_c0_g1_i1:86-1066(-)
MLPLPSIEKNGGRGAANDPLSFKARGNVVCELPRLGKAGLEQAAAQDQDKGSRLAFPSLELLTSAGAKNGQGSQPNSSRHRSKRRGHAGRRPRKGSTHRGGGDDSNVGSAAASPAPPSAREARHTQDETPSRSEATPAKSRASPLRQRLGVDRSKSAAVLGSKYMDSHMGAMPSDARADAGFLDLRRQLRIERPPKALPPLDAAKAPLSPEERPRCTLDSICEAADGSRLRERSGSAERRGGRVAPGHLVTPTAQQRWRSTPRSDGSRLGDQGQAQLQAPPLGMTPALSLPKLPGAGSLPPLSLPSKKAGGGYVSEPLPPSLPPPW